MLAIMPLRDRPMDAFLVFWFCLFAVSSLVLELGSCYGSASDHDREPTYSSGEASRGACEPG